MTKEELIELFEKIGVPYNEGIQNLDYNSSTQRIVFFEYIWESITASSKKYNTNVTYQISFFSLQPRDKKLLELRKELNLKNINPKFYHEYIKEKQEFHTYFSIDVLEDI